jgi:hypothetical protein
MKQNKVLEDAIKQIQILSFQNMESGAKLILYFANDNITDNEIANVCKIIREEFKKSKSTQAEEFINALRTIREEFLKNQNLTPYIHSQIEQMIGIDVIRNQSIN